MRITLLLGLAAAPALAAQAPPALRTELVISAPALAAQLSDSNLVLVHMDRDPQAYADAHLPGARFLPLRAIVTERAGIPNELPPVAQLDSVLESAGISNHSRIVIYGDPLAAARLFFTLDYLGLGDRASLLDGGLPGWKAAGLPVTQEVPAPPVRGRIEPMIQPGLLIDAAELSRRLRDPALALMDARPPAEWSGATPGDGVLRPGHIPGARSFFWRLALTSGEPAYLKEVAVLGKLLGRAGLAPGREVITYCRTGVQASFLYFVARYLGYRPRMYDGSFIEWSEMAELPVER